MRRVRPLVGLAVLALAAGLTPAEDIQGKVSPASHTGRVVGVEGNKLTMVATRGGREYTHAVGSDVKITVDGKPAKLTDLRKNMFVRVTFKGAETKTVAGIDARTQPVDVKDGDRPPPPG